MLILKILIELKKKVVGRKKNEWKREKIKDLRKEITEEMWDAVEEKD